MESFSVLKPTPETLAPNWVNQKHSQAPLKPVDPVTKTFRFLYFFKNKFLFFNLLFNLVDTQFFQ